MNISIFDLSIYIKFFVSLCALINPIGMIPIFTSMTHNHTILEKTKINLISNCAATLILLISLFFGNSILKFFGISMHSFRIAGGILIISVAYSMMNGSFKNQIQSNKNNDKNTNKEDISIVPLAIPLIAGPGAISSTIAWSMNHTSWINLIGCSLVIIIFSFFCWLCFRAAPRVVKILGKTGINIITRIMGLLLISLGIEFISVGIKSIILECIK